MKSRGRALIGITAAAVAVLLTGVLRGHRGADDLSGPPPIPNDAGPIQQQAPAGAVFVEDATALTSALADERGPSEIWLRPRAYEGDFVIGRKVALRGERGASLVGTGAGTVLTVTAEGAWVDNLTIRHSGRKHTTEDAALKAKAARVRVTNIATEDSLFGVSLGPCAECTLEHSRVRGTDDDAELRGDGIKLWEAHGAVVRRCVMEDSRDLVVWYSRHVLLEGNVIRRSRYGTHFMFAHDSTVRGSRLESNVVGVFVMYSNRLHVERNVLAGARGPAGVGIGFKESDGVDVIDNWVVANTTGIYLDRTPRAPTSPVAFERNVIALNEMALRLHSSEEGLTFRENDFHQNVGVIEVEGGGDALGTVFEGNHWSEYEGYDLDHDGRGDVAFEQKRLSGELTDAHPSLKFFEGTVAMGVFDAIARAVPVLAAHRVLIDPHPATTPLRPRKGV